MLKEIKIKTVSFLLHYANKSNNVDDSFYDYKRKFLTKYGECLGKRVQHVQKTCWGCNGTGKFRGYDNGWNYVHRSERECHKCNGTGNYSDFYTMLFYWKLGNYYFHTFERKLDKKENINDMYPDLPLLEQVSGPFKHKQSKIHLENECLLWIYLFTNWEVFKQKMRKSCYTHRNYTPMNMLNKIVFNLALKGHLKRKLKAKFVYPVKNFFKKFKSQENTSGYEYDDLPF